MIKLDNLTSFSIFSDTFFVMDRYILQQRLCAPIPPKSIYLVRHGESLHNAQVFASQGADANDPRYVDSPLTLLGESQARQLAARVAAINPQLIVTSPMTRATQTCLFASQFVQHIPILVNPLCTERLAFASDIGSPISILQRRFPMLDYSGVFPPDAWWWSRSPLGSVHDSLRNLRMHSPGSRKEGEPMSHVYKRTNTFKRWLLERPETKIMVFAHGVFLQTFMGSSRESFYNCQMKKVIL